MEIFGADVLGIKGQLVRFEAVKNVNRSGVTMLGLTQKVVKEGLTRAAEAISTLEGQWGDVLGNQGYTLDMTPAETPKNSSGLELPLAIMILQASVLQNLTTLEEKIEDLEEEYNKLGDKENKDKRKQHLIDQITKFTDEREVALRYRTRIAKNKRKFLLIGTLGIIGGEVKAPQYGLLNMIAAAEPGFTIICPEEAEIQAAMIAAGVPRVKAYKVADLQETWDILLGERPLREADMHASKVRKKISRPYVADLNKISGVATAKRAMRVAIAGGHNILLVGPAGHGKTMLAKAATRLLPDLTPEERLEVNKIYSAAGELNYNEVVIHRPYQEIQSGATSAAVFGGGKPAPRPGLVSKAHTGILFIDEINLLSAQLVESFRTVLSDGKIIVQRVNASFEFPSKVILVAAMNPCKCGWLFHYKCSQCNYTSLNPQQTCSRHPKSKMNNKCTCTGAQIEQFQRKLSGPMLDRIDLKVLLSSHDDTPQGRKYASSTVQKEIAKARSKQQRRYKDDPDLHCNGDLGDKSRHDKYCPKVDASTASHFNKVIRKLDISLRQRDKLLFVSQTISDLESASRIHSHHVDEAVLLMGLQNSYFQAMR